MNVTEMQRDEYDVEFYVKRVKDGLLVESARARKAGEFNFTDEVFEGFKNEVYPNEEILRSSAETEMENWGKHDENGEFQEIGADIRNFSVFFNEETD